MTAVLPPTVTVLVVEDQDQLRTLTRRILERQGYRVITAHDAEAAMRILEENSADVNVLISDVVMPGISGIALARRVHSRFPGMGIVLMSGYGGDDLASAGAGSWLDAIIAKPFTAATLLAAVQKAA